MVANLVKGRKALGIIRYDLMNGFLEEEELMADPLTVC